MARRNTMHESDKTNPNSHDDEGSRDSSANISNSYRRQTILNLHKSGITTDVISSQTGIPQEKVDKIIQDAYLIERRKGEFLKQSLHSSSLKSSSPNPQVDLNSITTKSQTRVWKTLEGEPEFVISVAETQNVLEKFARYKTTFVILNVDLLGSTRLSMTLPVDRLTMIIQAFNQEMSIVVKEFGGYVLKYVGDAVLAFFVTSGNKFEAKVACISAVNCAKCMLRIAREALNPILDQYDYPEMNLRIGIDIGVNAIIQIGWDIQSNIRKTGKNNTNINKKKKEHLVIRKPVYDILSYTMNIAVKMTALANPNHIVIGQQVYDLLDDNQRSAFQRLDISPEIWSYVSNNTGGNIYNIYTDI
ncbi:MAG: adenylate/guanylate cyclase domain-containing protein [Nitrososphaeraceae archaeon]|nr:adenylate/guanylate cyclase domain-containing protein [Nitrososphaeraceae archaeon]